MNNNSEGTATTSRFLDHLPDVKLLPYAVFALSLAMTVFFWRLYDSSLKTRAELIFKGKAEDIQARIIRRLHENEQVLRGGAGLFHASNGVTRAEWHRYFSTLDLSENFPGFQGIGFSQWIRPEEKKAHINKIRSEGFPGYTITPPGERPAYTSIIYLEPFDWRNQRAFGFDMFSEPVRRAAMETCRDSGKTNMSGKIILVQETDKDRQNGFLIYVPVYRRGVTLDTVEMRRNALEGFSYSPIRVRDFMSATLDKMPEDVSFEIYASAGRDPDNLLFSSMVSDRKQLPAEYSPEFRSELPLNIFGQNWLIVFQSLPPFERERLQGQSLLVLAGGGAVSLLLALTAFLLRSSRDKAHATARMLKEGQERLSFHIDNSPMASIELDSNFVVTRWGGEAEKIFGWTSAEALGKSILDLQMVYEEDIPIVRNTMEKLSEGATKYIVSSNRNYTKDRKVISCEWYNTILTDAQGRMVSVLSQGLDVSERIRSEKYKDMARQVLMILNEPGSLDTLIPHVLTSLKHHTGLDAVGIRLKDEDDFPYFFQDGFPQDFLTSENSLVRRRNDGSICRDDEGNICLECTCGLVISGKTDPTNPLFTIGGSCWTNDSFPLLGLPPGDDPRLHPRNECIHYGYASVALVPIRDEGRIVGLLQFNDTRKNCLTLDTIERFEDIATYIGAVLMRKRMENEKSALQQKLLQTQKLESLGVLAGGVAHDFNNILTSVIGFTELAMMRISHDSPIREYLMNIELSATRASDLAKQMLAYSGKGRFVVETIDLNGLLGEMINMLRMSISKKAVLAFDLQQPLPSVVVDVTQIRQVVMNLIINASEAIGDESGTISIATGLVDLDEKQIKNHWQYENMATGTYVFLEVADTGCGMNQDTVAKIFDPFFTTKFTGRGLGMAAVQGIVRGHKGGIKVNSEPGQGSAFKILIPTTGSMHSEIKGNADASSWKGTGTVLLVDDEESVRAVGESFLRELGFTPVTAVNGKEGIDVFKNNPDIVLVILDVTMPVMDGEQCLYVLRQLKSDVQVLMSSGYSEQEVVEKFAGKGLAGFIQKPYKLSAMRDAVMKVSFRSQIKTPSNLGL